MADTTSQLLVSCKPKSEVVLLQLLLVLGCYFTGPCTGATAKTSYEVVKSGLFPRLPAKLKPFRDPPVHGPVVAIKFWYSGSRVFGLQTTFLDQYKSPVHGYTRGNTTTTVTFDPNDNYFLTTAAASFASISSAGITAVVSVALLPGNRTLTSTLPTRGARTFLGAAFDLAAFGGGPPKVVVGLKGAVDETAIAQLGYIIQARTLSYNSRPDGRPRRDVLNALLWPESAVVRSRARPSLAPGLRPFDDGVTGEHGEIVELQIWENPTEGVLGIRSTFQDGFRSPVYGYSRGPSVKLTFDPETNPLIGIGARGNVDGASRDYRMGGLVFFAGSTSPPVRSRIFGLQAIQAYSDSADGKIVGLFGQIGDSYVVQLGVHVVSPANGLVVSSGPFPRVSPPTTVPFDHTGDNLGVSQIDVYYDNKIGMRGLRFTYVSRLGFTYTTPVYGRKLGLHKQLRFDYVDNPLVNVVVFVSNVLAGTGEVGVYGINFHTLKGDFIGTIGLFAIDYNLSDGTRRVVGFHGQADTVVNTLGLYTAPLS